MLAYPGTLVSHGPLTVTYAQTQVHPSNTEQPLANSSVVAESHGCKERWKQNYQLSAFPNSVPSPVGPNTDLAWLILGSGIS